MFLPEGQTCDTSGVEATNVHDRAEGFYQSYVRLKNAAGELHPRVGIYY